MRASARSNSRLVTPMNRPPLSAQDGKHGHQHLFDAVHFAQIEPVALAQLGRPARAVQKEYRFAIRSFDVDVRGSVIVRIYDHAQAIEPMNGRHDIILDITQPVGNMLSRTRAPTQLPRRRRELREFSSPALIPSATCAIPRPPS